MKAKIVSVPFEGAEDMLSHLADIFGEEERELERVQLLGEEREEKLDIVAHVYIDIAETDVGKQVMAKTMGFCETDKSAISIKGFSVPAIQYERRK